MAKTRVIQTSFSSGVLSPLILGRTDLDQYYKGLQEGKNIVLLPQGPLKRRGGTIYTDIALNKLTKDVTVPTMPNGGTAANIADDDDATSATTTTNISTVDPYVIAQVDLGVATVLEVADIRGIFLTSGSSIELRIESSNDNILWFKSGTVPLVGTNPQNFRLKMTTTASRFFRLVRVGVTDLSTAKFTLSALTFWTQSSAVSTLTLKDFSVESDVHYLLAFTEGNIRIYDGDTGLHKADIRTDYLESQLPDIRDTQSESVMLLFHEDVEPLRLVNLGTTIDWTSDTAPFTNIPQFDYNDSLSPTPTSDVQTLTFIAFVAGDTFQIDIEGVLSKNITFAGDTTTDERSATIANIQKNIQDMPVMGETGVTVTRTGALVYVITTSGESAKAFELFSGFPTSGTASKTLGFVHTATGSPRAEDVWGTTRGWPKTTCFYNGRLVLGGTKSKPQSLFMSRAGQVFDFDVDEGDDDDAIFVTISSRKLNDIVDVFPGRDLQIFTRGSEFTVSNSTPQTIDIVPQTSHGSLNIEAREIDGSTLFIDRNGRSLKNYLFNFNEDAYSTQDISVLSPELINSPVDLATLNGTASDDANWVFIINSDGTATVLNTLRSQDINGFTSFDTDGLYKSVAAVDDEVYFSVLRTVNGASKYFVERWSFDRLLDSSIVNPEASGTVVDLGHLEGETVGIVADGVVLADKVVSSGTITLLTNETGYTSYEVGIKFTTSFKPMPINTNVGSGQNAMRRKKLVRMNIRVKDTVGLLVEGIPVANRSLGAVVLDQAPIPINGIIPDVFNLTGWDLDAVPTFSQIDPAPMTILGIEYELESS
jgi:hypothetical protein